MFWRRCYCGAHISLAHGVYFIKYAAILLQTMTIELDEDFLFALLDFAKFKDAAWKEPTKESVPLCVRSPVKLIRLQHPYREPERYPGAGHCGLAGRCLLRGLAAAAYVPGTILHAD